MTICCTFSVAQFAIYEQFRIKKNIYNTRSDLSIKVKSKNERQNR